MPCFLYILENQAGKHYVGITKLSPKLRLIRHNRGDVYSTKAGRPWKLVYSEGLADYREARQREKQIKSWHGGNAFSKLIRKAGGSSNGPAPAG